MNETPLCKRHLAEPGVEEVIAAAELPLPPGAHVRQDDAALGRRLPGENRSVGGVGGGATDTSRQNSFRYSPITLAWNGRRSCQDGAHSMVWRLHGRLDRRALVRLW